MKIGDKVRVIKEVPENPHMNIFVGETGEIVKHVPEDEGFILLFDDYHYQSQNIHYWLEDELEMVHAVPEELFAL